VADPWIEEQKTRLAETQTQLDELKTRVAPRQDVQLHREPPPTPMTVERLERRQFWIVVALVVFNGFYFLDAIRSYSAGRQTVSVMFDQSKVLVLQNATGGGGTSYLVKVPLNEFPYDVELNQRNLSQWIGPSLMNLALLGAILYSFRERSNLKPPPCDSRSQIYPA
jgi:hypothetical protein